MAGEEPQVLSDRDVQAVIANATLMSMGVLSKDEGRSRIYGLLGIEGDE